MSAIHKFGSEEQKQRWLPGMAAGELIGCFGLTEPTAGSDPASMATYAPSGTATDWVLTGAKRWIGLASIADVAVIWAQTDDGHPRVRRADRHPGLHRDADRAEAVDAGVDPVRHHPRRRAAARRRGAARASVGLKGPFSCLNEARYGIMWGAMGAARDSYEAALRVRASSDRSSTSRSRRFQLTQQKLVDMVLEIQKGVLVALQTGRLKDAGTLRPEQISFGKLNNVREAIAICREARTILGGNGITLDYSPLRHANNLESVRTYEGTDEVHTLIMGRAITGIAAFR